MREISALKTEDGQLIEGEVEKIQAFKTTDGQIFETIADNLELLKQDGEDFDIGLFEEICDNQGFDLQGYLKEK